MPSNHLILCCPLLLLPSIFPSNRVFSNESTLRMRWPKDWSFSFNISPSNEHPGLISFRMDWLDLLIVQGTLKSLLQHHSSKASILQHSAFFIVQLSHPCMTTGELSLTGKENTGSEVRVGSVPGVTLPSDPQSSGLSLPTASVRLQRREHTSPNFREAFVRTYRPLHGHLMTKTKIHMAGNRKSPIFF